MAWSETLLIPVEKKRWRAKAHGILGKIKNPRYYCIVDNVKGSQLAAFCPQAIVYCLYLEFKCCYLKNLKVFNKSKRIIWAYSFALFKSILLRNRSLSNATWFYGGKKRKIGKGNLHLTENRLRKNETWGAADNYNYMCHICVKGFLDSNFNQAVIDKILIFHKIAPHSTFSQKSYFFKYKWNFLDKLLLPYKFYGRDMKGKYFFIFASCDLLIFFYTL